MKASISYTVNFDDIPKELVKFVHRAEEMLCDIDRQTLWDSFRDAIEQNDFDAAFENMHKIRTTLADTDICLNDCSQVLEGYLKSKYSQDETFQTETPAAELPVAQPPPPPAPMQTGGEEFNLERELAALKESSPELFPNSNKEKK